MRERGVAKKINVKEKKTDKSPKKEEKITTKTVIEDQENRT